MFLRKLNFGVRIVLELSNIDLQNIDLLHTHLDLLDTDVPSKHFVYLHNFFKTSSRHVFKTSLIRFQRNSFSSSKASLRRLARCLQDVLEVVKFLCLRRVEDVFKTNKCLLGSHLILGLRSLAKSPDKLKSLYLPYQSIYGR